MEQFVVASQMPIEVNVEKGVDAKATNTIHQEGSIKVVMTDENGKPTGSTWTHRCSMYDTHDRSVDVRENDVRLNNATGEAHLDMPRLFFLLPASVEIHTYTTQQKGIVAVRLPRGLQHNYFLYDGDQSEMMGSLGRLRDLIGEEIWTAARHELSSGPAETLRDKLKAILATGGQMLD